jgi:hypothetical protein
MTGQICLHIGLPKTGTTSLQELVFARHSGCRYFGQTNLWGNPAAKTVLRALLLDDEPLTPAREAVESGLDDKGALVISDEALSLGQFMLRATRWPIMSDHKLTARRACNLLGKDRVNVLIVLRNQVDWLKSWHRQGLKTGKYVETNFQRWITRDLGPSAELLFKRINFNGLYDSWAEVFGPARVHVRLYEAYRESFPELAANAAALLSIDENQARTLVQDPARNVTDKKFTGVMPGVQRMVRSVPMRKVLSYIPQRLRLKARRVFEYQRIYEGMNQGDRQWIFDRFAPSNQALFEKLGINGQGMGYF